MALGLDGLALDRSRYAGSGQRLPTTEGAQATSSVTCRSGSTPEQKLTRRPCSSSQRRLTSISAATASQCSTKSGTSAPLRSTGITPLHHYYGAVRPSPAHRYFRPRGWSRLRLFPWHRRPGSHVPYKSQIELRAAYMPDAAWAVSGHPPS